MAGSGKKWLLGCGLGCGIPLLLIIVLSIGGSVVMMKPFNRAVDTQKELTAAFGERADFVPPVDSLAPDRLASFIGVRKVLVPLCENFTEIGEKFRRMEELEEGGDEPSKAEVFGALGDVMSAAFGIAGNIGRFTQDRNEALLGEGMGLGEYIWIYTLVYNSWLGYEPNLDFESGKGGRYERSEQEIIRQLMRNHVDALNEAGRDDEAAAWLAELEHLERSEGSGVPWADSEVPVATAAALEPYRAELDALYCGATSAFEFSRIRKHGLSITAN